MIRSACGVALVAIGLLASGAAQADAASEARLREQLRDAVTRVRALEDENAALKVKLSSAPAAEPAVAAAPASPAVDPAELALAQAQLAQSQARNAVMEQQIAEAQKVFAQWKQSYEQAVSVARSRDAEAKKVQALYETSEAALKSCTEKNQALVALGDELVRAYREKGLWDAARDAEPVVGLTGLEYERIAQDYHGKVVGASVLKRSAQQLTAPQCAAPATVPDSPSTQTHSEKLYD